MTFEKKYKAHEKEKEIRDFWEKNQIYKFDENTKKPIFSIDTPPPTVSGRMHIGHAFSYTQTDFIARYKRMRGYEVFYPFGTDDNGLATEKLVQKEKKVDLRKLEREEAVKQTLEYLKENTPEFVQDWKDLGISADFTKYYSTIDKYSQKISQKSFIDLHKKGLIEQREGPILWDTVFETAIAQAELEDVEKKGYLVYIKAKLSNTQNTYVIFATTRPEMAYAVVGMSVEDEGEYVKLKVGDQYWITGANTYEEKFAEFNYEVVEKLKGENLIGQKAQIPLVNREVEISHDIAVKADFGTGIAYFCTYGGLEDIEWAARHKVEPVEIIDKKGYLTQNAKELEGLTIKQAREKAIEKLEENKDAIKKEEKTQIVNVGERSGEEVEYIVSKQWYVKYLDKKEYFFEKSQEFNWFPEFMKHRLENWIEGLNWDWGISRQRHFGIPIPVWYDEEGNIYLPDEEQLPVDPTKDRPNSAPKDKTLYPEYDVFDTWFTSGSTPFLSTGLVENQQTKEKLFPMDLRPQAHDIINFWLFYTMAKTNLLYEQNPFNDVAVSGFILDEKGRKMSKSKGNIIVPQKIASDYSYDGLRFSAAASKLGYDMPFQIKEVQTGIKIVNKLYNASKFADLLLKDFSKENKNTNPIRSIDKWIYSKVNNAVEKATQNFEKYEFSLARSYAEMLLMRDIADNYIEITKNRLWNPQQFGSDATSAQATLYNSLFTATKLLAPFVPYITEEVYQNFFSKYEDEISVHQTSWPESFQIDEEIEEAGDNTINIVSAVRKFKSQADVSLKTPLETLTIECDNKTKEFIEDSIDDIKSVTGAEKIIFDKASTPTEKEDIKIDAKISQ